MKILKIAVIIVLIIAVISAVGLWRLNSKLQDRIAAADDEWQQYDPPRIKDFGSTSSLKIIPLIDWHLSDTTLQGEVGVSYLLETDSVTILFDLGHNAEQENPSPLARNMERLGVSVDAIDLIVVSHNHLDHVGGMDFMKNATFGINPDQETDLSDKRIYTPIPMTYPGASPVTSKDPTVIAPGVATIGTIRRALFMGDIEEQSLAVHVKGKGLVLVVGCSHQTVTRILARTEQVFEMPVYGLFGGLHFPVPDGRMTMAGIDVQRTLASGNGPFDPLQMSEVKREMALVAERDPGLVGVGGHDSSDEVIAMFAEKFGEAYRYVQVGKEVIVD